MDYKTGSDYKYVGPDLQVGLAGKRGTLLGYFGDVGSLNIESETWSVKLHNLEAI